MVTSFIESSNGIFINGITQQPFQTVQSHQDDIIGIGCAVINLDDVTLYVYKVCITRVECFFKISDPTEIVNASDLPLSDCNTMAFPRQFNTYIDVNPCVSGGKRKTPSNDCDIALPSKVPKYYDYNSKSGANYLKERTWHNFLGISSRTSLNNIEDAGITFDTAVHIKEENDIEISDTKYAVANNWNMEHSILKYETYLNNNNKAEHCRIDDLVDHFIEGNKATSSYWNTINENKIDPTEGKKTTFDETNCVKGPRFIHSGDQIIKLEDELQLTDEDEEALLAVSSKESTSKALIKLEKIKHEPKTPFSDIDVVHISDDEDGIFLYPQLMDIKIEENCIKQEFEIKQENISDNIEKIVSLNVDDEVVILSDSDDDYDNSWLYKLSQSQLFNGNKVSDAQKCVIKEELDLGIWQEDDVFNAIKCDKPSTSKDFGEVISDQYNRFSTLKSFNKVTSNQYDKPSTSKDSNEVTNKQFTKPNTSQDFCKVTSEQSSSAHTLKNSVCHEKSVKSIMRKKNIDEHDETSNIHSSSIKPRLMNIDDIGPSNKPSLQDTSLAAKEKTDAKQNTEIQNNKQTSYSTSSLANIKSRLAASTKKIIPLIEAPYLPKRRGRPKNKDIKKDSSQDFDNDSSKGPINKDHNKSRSSGEKSYNQLYNKSPTSSVPSRTSVSKQEKRTLAEERKVKLKKLAEEKLTVDNNKNVPRIKSKPRAKITLKNRGDFLCNEQEAPRPRFSKSTERTKTNDEIDDRRTTLNEVDLPEALIHDIEANISRVENTSKQSSSLDTNKILEKNATKIYTSKEQHKMNTENAINVTTVPKLSERSDKQDSASEEGKKPLPKKKKTVTFAANLVEERFFEIESENTMKRLIGKDAPIPANKRVKTEIKVERIPKLEEFLAHIFKWNPKWLEEQRHFKTEPPVVEEKDLQPLKIRYQSYDHYYNVTLRLLLLETWQAINKDFEIIEKSAQRAAMTCSIVNDSIVRTPIPTTDLFLTTLMLEVLVTNEDMFRQTYPKRGDLVTFEYVKHMNNKQTFHKVFGYVTHLYESNLTDFSRYNKDLRKFVPNATQLFTYTVQMRPIDNPILLNRIHRVRAIKCLRSDMRMVQALQYTSQCPLLKLIVNPRIEDYQLSPMNKSFTNASLVMENTLNARQLEAVYKVTGAVLKKEDKLCLIQGPPGTGKTNVILNLVVQILYNHQKQSEVKTETPLKTPEKARILLCAPSNAAIDEIVIRLLNIRPILKQKLNYSFNLVRIGQVDQMHPKAKNISSSELAIRNLRKFAESMCSWSTTNSTSRTEEKYRLESHMDMLKGKLNSPESLTEAQKRETKRRLVEATCKYNVLMTGKLFDDIDVKDRNRYLSSYEEIILAGADIIACTLGSCYTNQMESIFGINKENISVCIVDEATQSIEAETLIPLMLGVKTMVLVGDPNQLPATVLSQRAKKLGLNQSIFSRIQLAFESRSNNPIIMLDTQHRMAYAISYWPNKYFYNAKLQNSTDIKLTPFPFHPYRVLNHGSVQNHDKFSNTIEAELVSTIIYTMLLYAKWEESMKEPVTLGIITAYNGQKNIMINKINEKICNLPESTRRKITYEVNTVDSFQGQERDIIIMSCVRSHGIGFMSDKQRLCVALTRAKHSLILCGNFNTFMENPMWNALLADAKSRGVFYNINAHATLNSIKLHVVK